MHVVVIGNGISGLTVARTLREHQPNINISMYTDEPYLYYPRPRLYDVLSGAATPSTVLPFTSSWYQRHDIQIHLNTAVTAINPAQQIIHIEGGSAIPYNRLVLAVGASPYVPPINGIETPGVFTLRTMHDALRIKAYNKPGGHATIIGGGLLGLEVAVALTKLGQHVQVIELLPRLLPRQLDADGAKLLTHRIEAQGIHVTIDARTHQITGRHAVSGVLLDTGLHLASSLVLVSAGVRPNRTLAQNAGLDTHRGIIVDAKLQTSEDHVYACGNAAEFQGHVYETIPAAIEQAVYTAHSILGNTREDYAGTTPLNTLKVAGIDLTSIGEVNPERSTVDVYAKLDRRRGVYKKLVLDQNTLIGAIILGDNQTARTVKPLMHHSLSSQAIHDLLA